MTKLGLAKWLHANDSLMQHIPWERLTKPTRDRFLNVAGKLADMLNYQLIPECRFTHSHTSAFCGNPDCRRS